MPTRSRSASFFLLVSAASNSLQQGEFLSHSGMDTNCIIQIFFGDTFQDSHCESLGDFSCMWTYEVEAYNFVVICFVDYDFSVTILSAIVVEIPFQRFEDTSIGNYIFSSEGFDGVLLAVSATAVFNRREDCCWYVFITHQTGSLPEQSISQQSSCHYSCGGQFQSALDNITNSIDAGH